MRWHNQETDDKLSTRINWPSTLQPALCPVYTRNELAINAPRELVWAWLIQAELWSTWYRNAQNVRIIQGTRPNLALGTVFTWKTFGVQVKTTVCQFVPLQQLAWHGTGLGAQGYHAWLIEPTATGCLVITEETQRGLVPSVGQFFLRRGLLREHQHWLEGLARLALAGKLP